MELRVHRHGLQHMHVNEASFGTLFAKRIMLESITEMSGLAPCT
jgi:hypothetical protein